MIFDNLFDSEDFETDELGRIVVKDRELLKEINDAI